jgi:hypothetical protein
MWRRWQCSTPNATITLNSRHSLTLFGGQSPQSPPLDMATRYRLRRRAGFFAVLLMIGAIGLVGSITATLASWIVQRVADEDTASEAVSQVATAAHIAELRAEIRELADELRRNGEVSPRFGRVMLWRTLNGGRRGVRSGGKGAAG